MARAATELAERLRRRMLSLDAMRRKQDQLYRCNHLCRRDVEHMYELLFLRAVTYFEAFLEELFFGIVSGRLDAGPDVHRRVRFTSDKVAHDVVLSERRGGYVNWMPYDETCKRAAVFLRGGRPFADLDPADRHILENAYRIRNVIAHRSDKATRTYENEVLKGLVLHPRERRAGGFLRSVHTVGPPRQTRWEQYSQYLTRIAAKLCGT